MNHSESFVDRYNPDIHTETCEGMWMHVKAHINGTGGTRQHHIQEKLNEFMFIKSYWHNDGFNIWVLLTLLSEYGVQAIDYCKQHR